MIIAYQLNKRKALLQAHKHSYDKFETHVKKHGTYLGYSNNVDYYYCQGYIASITRELKNSILEIVGSGVTVNVNRLPKQFRDAYQFIQLDH